MRRSVNTIANLDETRLKIGAGIANLPLSLKNAKSGGELSWLGICGSGAFRLPLPTSGPIKDISRGSEAFRENGR